MDAANAAPVNVEEARRERMARVLGEAKSALMEAICIAGEEEREQAQRLIRLWSQVDAEVTK